MFATYRKPSEDMARAKDDCLTLKECRHMTAIFTPLGSSEFAAGALGLWNRTAVGGETVSRSLVKCLKGGHDPGALIARDRTVGSRQSPQGLKMFPRCWVGAEEQEFLKSIC